MGVCRALALFGDAKQAMGEGKSGPVANRTNWTGGYGPVELYQFTMKLIFIWAISI